MLHFQLALLFVVLTLSNQFLKEFKESASTIFYLLKNSNNLQLCDVGERGRDGGSNCYLPSLSDVLRKSIESGNRSMATSER